MKNLSTGALPEMLSPYIRDLIQQTGGAQGPIGKQFLSPPEDPAVQLTESDPQQEQHYEVAPGLIYKYKGQQNPDHSIHHYGRALWTISRYCATYCRFCFRGRFVGLPATKSTHTTDTLSQKPFLSEEDINTVITYLHDHPEINEIILSGGDPLVTSKNYLINIISKLVNLQSQQQLQIVRIHTRAPITNPAHLRDWHYQLLQTIHNPHIVLHINHPAEITTQVIQICDRLRRDSGAILLSQSVLLKGVNDNQPTLIELFNSLVHAGIRPYYLHQNDPVSWASQFTVPIPEAIQLWRSLRPYLSGLAASAKFVIDTPHGVGKIPFPDYGFPSDSTTYLDFLGHSQTFASNE